MFFAQVDSAYLGDGGGMLQLAVIGGCVLAVVLVVVAFLFFREE